MKEDIETKIVRLRNAYQDNSSELPEDEVKQIECHLFRLYECKYFLIGQRIKNFDSERYLSDHNYYRKIWREVDESWDSAVSTQLYNMAIDKILENELYKAGVFFLQSATMGDPDSQYNLGITVSNGEMGEADKLLGAFWFWEAAKHGHSKAMYNLASAYSGDGGVKVNHLQKIYWLAKAAESCDYAKAVYALGQSLVHDIESDEWKTYGEALMQKSENLEDNRNDIVALADRIVELLADRVYNVE